MKKLLGILKNREASDFSRICADFANMNRTQKAKYSMHLNTAIVQAQKGEDLHEDFADWSLEDLQNLREYLKDPTKMLKGTKKEREPIPMGIKRLAVLCGGLVAATLGGEIWGSNQSKEEAGHAMVETASDFDQIIEGHISIQDLKIYPLAIFVFPDYRYNPESSDLRVKGYSMNDIIQYAADHDLLDKLEKTLIELKPHANNFDLDLPPQALAEENFKDAIDYALNQIRTIKEKP